MRLALAGALPGIAIAIAVGLAARSLLFGVSAIDPVSLIGAAALIVGATVIASLAPAQRAARLDPLATLSE